VPAAAQQQLHHNSSSCRHTNSSKSNREKHECLSPRLPRCPAAAPSRSAAGCCQGG
jgi:hypothetical protein